MLDIRRGRKQKNHIPCGWLRGKRAATTTKKRLVHCVRDVRKKKRILCTLLKDYLITLCALYVLIFIKMHVFTPNNDRPDVRNYVQNGHIAHNALDQLLANFFSAFEFGLVKDWKRKSDTPIRNWEQIGKTF